MTNPPVKLVPELAREDWRTLCAGVRLMYPELFEYVPMTSTEWARVHDEKLRLLQEGAPA